MSIQLVWFKRDLRLDDHRPLHQAARRGPVLGLYIVEPEVLAMPETHPRHLAFILQSLRELRERLRARGSELLIRVGEAVGVLDEVRRELEDSGQALGGLFSHEETGQDVTFARDRRVKTWARARGVAWAESPQFGVVRGLKDRNGWAARWESLMNEPPVAAPEALPALPSIPAPAASAVPGPIPELATVMGLVDREWPAVPGPSDPNGYLALQQPGGESAGRAVLESFLAGRGVNYRAGMASPVHAWNDCSRLSPHFAWGTLSMRRVHHATRSAVLEATQRKRDSDPALDRRWLPSLRSFEKRLRWHCHFIQKLESEPAIEFHSMNRAYEGLRKPESEWGEVERARFVAWTEGRTGYPMVDACMRALDATGWINFRMRAMIVSFAAYHLWLDWRPVARELAGRFLDHEPGIHISQCQMQSGVTGINQLRIYSPSKQVQDNDPRGEFIRKWVPELAEVPDAYLPNPELMSEALQERAGCRVGVDYPAPIVDHRTAVREARARMGAVRSSEEARRLARGVFERHGSRKQSARSRGLGRGKAASNPQLGLDL